VGIEGVRRLIAEPFEHRPVLLLHHGRQLQEVSHHHDLDAAERPFVAAHLAQPGIDGVDHVGPHHGNLVDDEPFHAPIERSELAALGEIFGVENGVLQVKERMNGLGAGVERRDPGRRHRRLQLAAGPALDVLHKPRFAGAGAARDEDDGRSRIDGGERLANTGARLIGFVPHKRRRLCRRAAFHRDGAVEIGEFFSVTRLVRRFSRLLDRMLLHKLSDSPQRP